MNSETRNKNNSTYFFSNIRATIVLLVIVLHVALAYSSASDNWWIIVDSQKTIIADVFAGALDIMLMPILFFIAGYFAAHSYQKCGSSKFLIKKTKNLMLPWLMGVLFLNPFLVNVIHFRESNHGTIFNITVSYYRTFFKIPEVILQDRSESPFFFSHYHLWFLSLLFYFFIGFMLFNMISKNIKLYKPRSSVEKIFIYDLISLIIISSLGYFIFHEIFRDEWFVISIVQFQISRLIPYIGFFIFGIRSYYSNWINKVSIIKHPVIHLALSISLTLFYLSWYEYVNLSDSKLVHLLFSFLRYLICTYYLLIFLRIGQKYFNKKTTFNTLFTRSSFGVYLIHLNITILFSIVSTKMARLAPEFKMVLVFIITVFVSHLIIILYDKAMVLTKNKEMKPLKKNTIKA